MTAEVLVRGAVGSDPVGRVIRDAFGEEGEQVASLWAEVAGAGLSRSSLVAEHRGAVVGHVGLSHAWLDARPRLVDVWLLSPLSVVPGEQGAGIGTRLVASAVEQARSSGAPLLFLEGSPRYYGRRGFERADVLGFRPASARTPGPAFQVVRFPTHETWMTGQLVYHDVWWRHDGAGLRDPVLAQLEERHEEETR